MAFQSRTPSAAKLARGRKRGASFRNRGKGVRASNTEQAKRLKQMREGE